VVAPDVKPPQEGESIGKVHDPNHKNVSEILKL
jgi:hypothetical protein